MLLAYYIADVNIESVFQEQCPQSEYLRFDGICLTDTFQLGEDKEEKLFGEFFCENSEAVKEQKRKPIRVIIGNPPYSIGQKSANDNAQNQSYPVLDKRIADTYVAASSAGLSKGIYDSYIRAFRWATDRLASDEGSIVAFISNGAWIDGISHDGFRASLQKEFDKIYVFNLRGNQRTSGELSRQEGGKIFGSGSRTPIAITILVRYPADKRLNNCEIYYHDIGDYLSREDKLRIIRQTKSCLLLRWESITPNEKNDWINQRDGLFDALLPLAPEKKFDAEAKSVFETYSLGIVTSKDAFLYNFSSTILHSTVQLMIAYYNSEREQLAKNKDYTPKTDPKKIVWTDMFLNSAHRGDVFSIQEERFGCSIYRPFCKQKFLYQKELIQRTYQQLSIFPTPQHKNLCICVSGVGASKGFSCLISDKIPSLDFLEKTQCFPLYWYEENKQRNLFNEYKGGDKWIRHDGISDWFLAQVHGRFGGARELDKADIFYYVYGLLHSPDYRARFADDLRKALPRIPIVERVDEFMVFSKAGRALADLHLHYEDHAHEAGVLVEERERNTEDEFAYYTVEKMRFPSKENRSTILYNARITIANIPEAAYAYMVNGKSAIEWLMERYAITTDKKSGIKNDPNLWAREHQKPRYILDLLLSILYVSLETQKIVQSLPKLEF